MHLQRLMLLPVTVKESYTCMQLDGQAHKRPDGQTKAHADGRWTNFGSKLKKNSDLISITTVLPAKSDSDVVFCLHFLSKALNCTLHT